MGFRHEDVFRLRNLMEEKLTCGDSVDGVGNSLSGKPKNGVGKAAKIIHHFLNN